MQSAANPELGDPGKLIQPALVRPPGIISQSHFCDDFLNGIFMFCGAYLWMAAGTSQ